MQSVLQSKYAKPKNFYIHRLVALTFIENPKGLTDVNHKDFNRSNNHVDNLEWCTQKENMQHAHQNGRIKSYEEFIKKGLEARQKPVIDLLSGITYKSLTIACKTLGIHPNSEWYRIKRNQKEKRFTFA